MKSKLTSLLRAPALSIASQSFGLAQLALLLLFHGGATESTDTYLYLFTLGITPTLVLTIGVLYPSLLTPHLVSRWAVRAIALCNPVASAGAVALGAIWLSESSAAAPNILLLTAIMSFNSALQSRTYYWAIRAESTGNALWTASLAIPPNMLACAVLLFPWTTSNAAVIAMAIAITCGNVTYLALIRRFGRVRAPTPPGTSDPGRFPGWFLARAITGNLAQTVIATLAVPLPASSITYLNLASKVVGAGAVTMTNALAPLFINSKRTDQQAAKTFLVGTSVFMTVMGAAIILIGARYGQLTLAVTAAIWAVAAASATVLSRMSFRYLPPSASKWNILTTLSILGATFAVSHAAGFSVNTLMGALALFDLAIFVVYSAYFQMIALRNYAILLTVLLLTSVAVQLLA